MRVFEIVDNAVRSITILKSDKISKKKNEPEFYKNAVSKKLLWIHGNRA